MPEKFHYLLVPGTGGTDLASSNGNRWQLSYILTAPFAGDARQLSCAHDPVASNVPWERRSYQPARSTLLAGELLADDVLLDLAYKDVKDHGGYDVFPFDWRLDIRHSAQKLLQELRAGFAATGRPWKILTHSQGGLVLLAASKMARAAEWHGMVAAQCLVAPPLFGNLVSLAALLVGNIHPIPLLRELAAGILKDAASTWPAIMQMGPQFQSLVDRGVWRSIDAPDWQRWNLTSGQFAEVLARSAAYLADVGKDPLSEFGVSTYYRIRISLGNNPKVNTVVGLSLDENGMPQIGAEIKERGDGLVPYERTRKFLLGLGLPANRIRAWSQESQSEHMLLLHKDGLFPPCHAYLESVVQ